MRMERKQARCPRLFSCGLRRGERDAEDAGGCRQAPALTAGAHAQVRDVPWRRSPSCRPLSRTARAARCPLRSNGIAISKSIDHAGMAPGRLCAIWHENPAISHSTGQNRLFFTGKRAKSRSTGHMPIRMPFGATLCHGSIGHMPIRLLCNVIPCHAEQTSSTHF